MPILAGEDAPSLPPLRVLLAEGQPLVLQLLRDLVLVRLAVVVVGEVALSADLLSRTIRLAPDLVLLDWALGGLAALQALRALKPAPQVIMLTDGDEPEYNHAVLARGGAACLPRAQLHRVLPPAILLVSTNRSQGALHGGIYRAPAEGMDHG